MDEVKQPRPAALVTEKDICVSTLGGGRGVGDPLDREPQRVLDDILGKKVSLTAAKEVYGVVIDPDKMEIDIQATDATRVKIKENRKAKGKIWEGK